jgi:hypothetical protein
MDLPLQENSRSGQRPIVCSVVMGYIHSMTPQLLVTNGGPGAHGENRPRYVLSSPNRVPNHRLWDMRIWVSNMQGTGYHVDLPQIWHSQLSKRRCRDFNKKVVDHIVELRYQSSPVACRERSRGFDFVHNLLHMTGEKVLQPFVDSQRQLVALFNGDSSGTGRCGWHDHRIPQTSQDASRHWHCHEESPKNGLFPDLQQTINCRCFWRHGGTIFVVALRSHVSLSTSEFWYDHVCADSPVWNVHHAYLMHNIYWYCQPPSHLIITVKWPLETIPARPKLLLENQELVPGEIYNWEALDPGGFRSEGDAILSEYKRHSSKGMRPANAQNMEGPVTCT